MHNYYFWRCIDTFSMFSLFFRRIFIFADASSSSTLPLVKSHQRAFIYCSTEELNTIANFMEKCHFEDISSKIIWKAKEPIKIGIEQLQKVAKLIEALEDDDDVRSVTSNFEASDEDLEALSS